MTGRVVVGVDDSPVAHAALQWAAAAADLRGAPLTALYATAPPAGPWPVAPVPVGYLDWQQQTGRDLLTEAAGAVDRMTGGRVAVATELAVTAPAQALVEASRTAELVVVGSRGRGAVAARVLGSTSAGVVQRAHCPVAVVREAGAPADPAAPVLLGFDGSENGARATELAFQEAARRGVGLTALHAWWSPGAFEMPGFEWESIRGDVEDEVARQLAGWQRRYPDVGVERVVVVDQPADRLVEKSATAQLLVVGSRGYGALAGALLGSVANAVVQAAGAPVIVVPPQRN